MFYMIHQKGVKVHRQFLQLIKDNAAREVSALRVVNSDEGAEIYLYDVIDPLFGIGAADFVKELSALKGKPVALHINSPGGDVFDARAMATAIAAHGDVTAHIDGLAASAATYVATAAKKVLIADGSLFMVHNAWTFAYGNKHDLQETAALLDKIDDTIKGSYIAKTGKGADEITALMDAETWLTAAEAVENGFADEVIGGETKAQNTWNLAAFKNAPKPPAPTGPSVEELAASQRQRNLNRLRLYEIG